MVLCSCGQFTEEGTTLCPRCEALHVLGLGVEALENEIRSAYRLLSKAWQPENFADDPKLKDSAEAKFNDIQLAYEFLTLTSTDRVRTQRPAYLSTKLAAAAAVPAPVSDLQMALGGVTASPPSAIPNLPSAPAATPIAASPQEPPQTPQTPQNPWQKFKIPIIAAAGILALALLLLIWTASSAPNPSEDQTGSSARRHPMNPLVRLLAQGLNAIDPPPTDAAPKSSTLAQPSPVPDAQGATPEANQSDQTTSPADAKNPPPGKNRAATPGTQPATAHGAQPAASNSAQIAGAKLKPYITVGSTRAEVIALEGNPTASSEDKLVYGKSELILKDGTVLRWRIDRASSPLRVKLWPHGYVDPYLDFFTVGSSKDEVIKVQGTPTAFTEDQFEYNGAVVYFSNNRVVRWKSDPSSVTLWAK